MPALEVPLTLEVPPVPREVSLPALELPLLLRELSLVPEPELSVDGEVGLAPGDCDEEPLVELPCANASAGNNVSAAVVMIIRVLLFNWDMASPSSG